MARKLREAYVDGIYHVGTRGNDRRDIYRDGADRYWFLEIMNHIVVRYGWVVYSYCLMTTHYHCLVQIPEGGLSDGMRDLNGRFARWSNWRHSREDHVFGKRFWSGEITDEEQFLETCRYIVLNPVRAGVVSHPRDWHWSSYAAAAGEDYPHSVLAVDQLLRHFGSTPKRAMVAYRRFVEKGLGASGQVPVPGTGTKM